MKNLTKLVGITIFVAVIGFSMAACKNDTTPSTGGGTPTPTGEGWKSVTSLSQLGGTWKSTANNSINLGDFEDLEDLEGITASGSTETTLVINGTSGLFNFSVKVTITFSGDDINSKWSTIKTAFGAGEEDGFTFNDSAKTATMTVSASETMTLSDVTSANIQINSNGTKIKIPAGAMDTNDEMILTKQ